MKFISVLLFTYSVLSLCSCTFLIKDKAEIKKILKDAVDEAVDDVADASKVSNDLVENGSK